MKEIIIKWYCRNFNIIDVSLTEHWNLKWKRNVYGDEINYLNCRSIWVDNKGREYRVRQLMTSI